MLTRTNIIYIYMFIPSARVLLDLGNVSVNRRIFINTHAHFIHTCTHTYRINYVLFFSRHDVSVVIIMMYTSRIDIVFPTKLFMETKAIEWCFLILLRGLFLFFRYGSIACLKRAFGWRLFMKGSRTRRTKEKEQAGSVTTGDFLFFHTPHFWF